jgi:hypothetical protein
MKIDRHNYEEFFILYWDNELTASQKQAVENFVKENTDFKDEFQILGETRFTPDNHVRLEEKEFLQNNSSINITNYEEQLLNYIDDELSIEERSEVERSALKHPMIQKELTLLQKTKLQPESAIVFPDKSTLYRREEKVRVISMTSFRVAVAAAIILIAGLITFRLISTGSKNGDKNEIATNVEKKDSNSLAKKSPLQATNPIQKGEPDNLVKGKEKPVLVKQTINKKDQAPVVEDRLPNNTVAVTTSANKNKLPKEGSGKILNEQAKAIESAIASVDDPKFEKKDYNSPEKNKSNAINTSIGESDVTLQAKPALYIPEAEEKEKGGLKEFLRKTTRVFERRTKIQTTTDDNKLLVGAFAVSLK